MIKTKCGLPPDTQDKRELEDKTNAIERVWNFANNCLEQYQRSPRGDLHKPEVYRDILKV